MIEMALWVTFVVVVASWVAYRIWRRPTGAAKYPHENLAYGSTQFGSKYAEALADQELADRAKREAS